jgi:hypothetical protein
MHFSPYFRPRPIFSGQVRACHKASSGSRTAIITTTTERRRTVPCGVKVGMLPV